jgi:hypothetical protein
VVRCEHVLLQVYAAMLVYRIAEATNGSVQQALYGCEGQRMGQQCKQMHHGTLD